MRIPRIMIAAPMSGCGKTTIACGLMYALKSRGYKIAAAKCGPDYIDPMFHREVLGIDSQNLDLFFCGQEVMKGLFAGHTAGADAAVIEGMTGCPLTVIRAVPTRRRRPLMFLCSWQ